MSPDNLKGWNTMDTNSLGMIETKGLVGAIEAADAMVGNACADDGGDGRDPADEGLGNAVTALFRDITSWFLPSEI